ncbi:mechanosensitive ion channel family protein [Seongchinamella sediminis]|uniref:Mechanosensitive ion channel family protein n=1 Tax=Seongchinamella sediminis TaxID=2283635 RepID=A0A3L7DXD6_9GAMM|nr:mechanosensitive ion channel family protein [Seongchinamella sediminis]
MRTLLVPVLLMLLCALPLRAQQDALPQSVSGSAPSQQEIDQLLATLEDPQRREAFVSRLKALNSLSEQQGAGEGLEISEALKLDQRVGKFIKNYLALLSESDVRASSIGKIVALAVCSLLAICLALGNAWLSRLFNRQLDSMRQRLGLSNSRLSSVFSWQRQAGYILSGVAWFYALAVIVFDQHYQSTVSQGMVTVAQTTVAVLLVVLLFLLIWEVINALLESLAERKDGLNNRRVMTVLPVVRNVLTFVLVLLSSLVILSELGIDVMPLLAGAGVLGIAVGFGAQTLVKDFLTGFTIIIEDLLQKDDVVTVAGRTGFVTHISMRKLELRSLEGTVHTVPFSAIDIVDNLTKDYSYYLLNVGVAYREDTDEVVECLKAIDEDMRSSDDFADDILEPLEVLGVDEFADSAVVIKARTKTAGREKWRVGREFNRRIKIAFDERNIEIPFPHQTLYFGVDKDGNAPPLPPARAASAAESEETESA